MKLGFWDSVQDGLVLGISETGHPLFLLEDQFSDTKTAGNVNLSIATDSKSIRYVNDTNNLMNVRGGMLNVSGTQSGADDFKPGLWYDSFPRDYVIAATIFPGTRGPDYVGWYKTPENTHVGTWGNDYSVRFVSNNVYAGVTTGGSGALGAYTTNAKYQVIVWIKPNVGGEIWIKGGIWPTWSKIHTDTTLTTPVYFPVCSYYVDTTPRNVDVDLFRVCKYKGNNWDEYFSCGGSARTIVPIALFGDSKETGYYWPGILNTSTYAFQEIPTGKRLNGAMTTRMATAGATVASRSGTVAADLAAITDTAVPSFVLWNLGANDVASLPAEAGWKANAQACIDAILGKWPATKIYFMQVWVRNEDADCNTINGWYADLVTSNPSTCFLGPDERVFLKGSDNGVTNTSDGLHPTFPAGYQLTAQNWRGVLGY